MMRLPLNNIFAAKARSASLPLAICLVTILPPCVCIYHPAKAVESESSESLSLQKAVQVARTHGLDVLLADANTQIAVADERAAGAVINPAISASYGRSLYYSQAQRDYAVATPGSVNAYSIGVTDQAALFDSISGKRGLRRDVARAAVKVANMNRLDAERVLVAAVKLQYVQLALSEQVLEFVIQTRDSTAQTRDLVASRFRAGAVSEADVARAESAKLESDQAVDAARGDVKVQQATLAFLLGVRGQAPNYYADAHVLDYREPAALTHLDSANLIRLAQRNRPDLKAAEYQEQQARAALAHTRRQRIPDVALWVSYSQMGNGQNAEQPSSISVGVSAPIPVFYQNQGEIAHAGAAVSASSIQTSKVSAQMTMDVTANWASFSTARSRVVRMQSELLRQVRTALDLVTIQYEKGTASLLELLDARRTYNSVNLEYRQDLADYWSAMVRLEQAIGMELAQ